MLQSEIDNKPSCSDCGSTAIWKKSVVLDPFAGSGTTAEAARREGFDCILMEAEQEYIDFLCDRFAITPEDDDLPEIAADDAGASALAERAQKQADDAEEDEA